MGTRKAAWWGGQGWLAAVDRVRGRSKLGLGVVPVGRLVNQRELARGLAVVVVYELERGLGMPSSTPPDWERMGRQGRWESEVRGAREGLELLLYS